jgi:hypothetical protein
MGKSTLLTADKDAGRAVIDRLRGGGLDVRLAFWAFPTEDDEWRLYVASPVVDEAGPTEAYRRIHRILRPMPGPEIDPLQIKAIGLKDSLYTAALKLVTPPRSEGPFAQIPTKPYPGDTQYNGSTLGGVSIEGALIYPPLN